MKEITNYDHLDKLIRGFTVSRIILTAVYIDIFTKIGDKKISSKDLADANDWDLRGTTILLDVLCAIGLINKNKDLYSNTKFTNANLRRDKKGFKGWSILHRNTLWLGWSNLTEIITKKPVVRPSNTHNKEFNQYFINAMHQFHFEEGFEMADLLGIKKVNKMIDLAGGAASYSIAFAKKNPKLTSVIADLPNTLSVAKGNIAEHKLEDRIILKECDLFSSNCDLGSDYDLALISHLFHAASEEQNIALLKRVYPILNKGGRVVVNEFYIDDTKTKPLDSAIFSVNMLVQTEGGNTYPQSQIKKWLIETGFKPRSLTNSITIGTK